jgi:hypothetical protein
MVLTIFSCTSGLCVNSRKLIQSIASRDFNCLLMIKMHSSTPANCSFQHSQDIEFNSLSTPVCYLPGRFSCFIDLQLNTNLPNWCQVVYSHKINLIRNISQTSLLTRQSLQTECTASRTHFAKFSLNRQLGILEDAKKCHLHMQIIRKLYKIQHEA